MFVIAASPLTKAFLRDWSDRLQLEPDLIFKQDIEFSFIVPRGTGPIKLEYNKPTPVASLLRGNPSDKDILTLYNWLIGGSDGLQTQETDVFGIVPYEPGFDPVREMQSLADLENFVSDDPKKVAAAKKRQADKQKEIAAAIKNLKTSSKSAADARVLRHMKWAHNNLIKQWQLNDEMKLGKHQPSTTEMLGAHALSDIIKKADEKARVLKDRMNEIMKTTVM